MKRFRRLVLTVGVGILLACNASGRAVLAPLPVSRLAREVVVFRSAVEVARLTAPGQHEVVVPCANAPGRTARLQVEIALKQPAPPEGYREVDAGELRRLSSRDAGEKVQFVDMLREEMPVALPDGRLAAASRGFVTVGGILCLVPADTPGAAEAAVRGARVRAWGVTVAAQGGAVVILEGIRPEPAGPTDEPPWHVTARWGARDVLSAHEPGDYPLRLPCAHVAGAEEVVGVRVRQFRVSNIQVDGHSVTAELAATSRSRSYGLQGRAGLAPDHGMLFWFSTPEVPTFVMKSVSFPLSIAFMREDGTITNIVRLHPGDRRTAQATEPVRYVLEMGQGWFRAHGVTPGKKVIIP